MAGNVAEWTNLLVRQRERYPGGSRRFAAIRPWVDFGDALKGGIAAGEIVLGHLKQPEKGIIHFGKSGKNPRSPTRTTTWNQYLLRTVTVLKVGDTFSRGFSVGTSWIVPNSTRG